MVLAGAAPPTVAKATDATARASKIAIFNLITAGPLEPSNVYRFRGAEIPP